MGVVKDEKFLIIIPKEKRSAARDKLDMENKKEAGYNIWQINLCL